MDNWSCRVKWLVQGHMGEHACMSYNVNLALIHSGGKKNPWTAAELNVYKNKPSQGKPARSWLTEGPRERQQHTCSMEASGLPGSTECGYSCLQCVPEGKRCPPQRLWEEGERQIAVSENQREEKWVSDIGECLCVYRKQHCYTECAEHYWRRVRRFIFQVAARLQCCVPKDHSWNDLVRLL